MPNPLSLPDDLPEEVAELIRPHLLKNAVTLDAIGKAIAERRDEARAARTTSGIEALWKDCEEAYIGIDDANRKEFQGQRWAKPLSMDGPVTTDTKSKNPDHKSTAYVRLTARYVDAGTAKVAEILLSPDDKSFSLTETPDPKLIRAKDNKTQIVHDDMRNIPATRDLRPGEVAPAPQGAQAGNVVPFPQGAAPPAGGAQPLPAPLTVKDIAEEAIELARKKAKGAEKTIWDWMVQTQYVAEVRKVIHDAARLGVGVLKGPVPKPIRSMAFFRNSKRGAGVEIEEKIIPASKWVDPWNIFPDPACGENIHDGDYVFERDYLSEKRVRALKDEPDYIAAQIDKVLIEGPDKPGTKSNQGMSKDDELKNRKGRYEVWYYYGSLKQEEMDCIAAGAGKVPQPGEKPKPQVYVIVTLINRTVIRATINPLDSGAFPYHSMPWQRRSGHWAGIGVGEQVRMPQKSINAAWRALLNNAGVSAGGQWIIDGDSIQPVDGQWIITPNKLWRKKGDNPLQDVRAAMTVLEIPNVTEQMMIIVNAAKEFAEECTSIPLITQGQSGRTTPDTFGAAQLQDNNANQLLRAIGYSFDDHITEPLVRQYYEWWLLDPDIADEDKDEFQINAHGSVALVERAIQDQTLGQLVQIAQNPAAAANLGADPKKIFKEFLKSKRIDPHDIQNDEEVQARLDANPPPPLPVQVQQVKNDALLKLGVMKQGADQQSVASEERIEQAAQVLEGQRVVTEQHRVATEATIKLHELQLKHEHALLEYANRERVSLTQAKSNLARTAMTLDTQRELNAQDNAVTLHKHAVETAQRTQKPEKPRRGARPPDQLPGKAGNGRAFEQTPGPGGTQT